MIGQLIQFAVKDLRHERLSTLCQIVVIAAILSPLVIQLGLVNGVVRGLIGELERNPNVLRVHPVRSLNLSADDASALRARDDVAYAMPTTRDIASIIELARNDDSRYPTWVSVAVLPTSDGDPVSIGRTSLAPSLYDISLSENAAHALNASAGDSLKGLVTRIRRDIEEEKALTLTVHSVIESYLDQGRRAYIHPDLLEATERFKDNHAIPLFGVDGDKPWSDITRFAGIRLYAADIHSVAGIAQHARTVFGVDVKTDAATIRGTLLLTSALRTIFAVLAGVAAVGLAGALLASMSASVERKRRSLAVLSLIGYTPRWLTGFPVVQAVTISLLAMLVVFAVVFASARVIEAYFADTFDTHLATGSSIISLTAFDWILACIGTVCLSCLPAVVAGVRASRIEPSEALRDV